MAISSFSPKVIQSIGYYVYCLVDPRDNSVFYIGKGCGNRVFDHVRTAESMYDVYQEGLSLKIQTIKDILSAGLDVRYWIIRHHLTEEEAYLVESVLIDWVTYQGFNLKGCLANIQAGHHQWDDGIKTVDEIQVLYNCPTIGMNAIKDRILALKIQRTYTTSDSNLKLRHPNVYQMTRKYWRLNVKRAQNADYVFGVCDGIVRGVFIADVWYQASDGRYYFEGREVTNSPYLNIDISSIVKGQNPVRYINC